MVDLLLGMCRILVPQGVMQKYSLAHNTLHAVFNLCIITAPLSFVTSKTWLIAVYGYQVF